ncbi:MAG: hypothetical protein COX07_09225 [Bacteroidetes bacterium CG23_combo_of_CG06-09_8_20_14_all_32_9]|nr:MAG: hypothetical protein COX07_09225 [Bacteroidetes bacterium CG23_combo_of_CG06-09_8_20_14_all_32_9]
MLSNITKISLFSKERILLIIILLSCFFSYFQITSFNFIRWDDDEQITENTYVKSLNLQNIKHNLYDERYTFLTLTSYSVIYNTLGNNPAPFHWFSIILHLLNVILVFFLSKKLSNNLYTVYFVVLLFALHPMRVESVAWISEAKDLLFTFFALTSFLFYIKYLQNNFKPRYFLLAATLALFASFSKIQGLFVPVSFYLFDIYYKRKFSVILVMEKILLFLFVFFIFNRISIVLLVSGIIFYFTFRKKINNFTFNKNIIKWLIISAVSAFLLFGIFYIAKNNFNLWSKIPDSRNVFTFFERFVLAGFALGFYIKNLFLPVSLNAVHIYPQRLPDGGLPHNYYFTLIVLFIVIIMSFILIIKRKKIPALLFFGWFFFLVNISMVLHFIPIEGRLLVADRYSYLAYFGLFISLSGISEKYLFQTKVIKKFFFTCFALLVFLLSLTTYNRCTVWRNTQILFTDVLQKNSHIPFAYLNLAAVYLNKQKPDSALIYFNESIKQDPLDATAYFNRAFAYIVNGNSENALNDFQSVLHLSPSIKYKALAYTNIGEIYHKHGNDSLASVYYNLSLQTDSSLALAYNNRGKYFLDINKLKEANSDFNRAVNLDKYYAEAWNNLGWVLTMQGKLQPALKDFNRSLELNPDYPFAYNNRGYLKFMSGDVTGAFKDYNKALTLDPSLYQAYLNRGWAFAFTRNYKNAVDDFTYILNKQANHQIARNNRAFAWFYLKEYKNAAEDFKTNVTFYPQNAVAWQNLAWFHTQIKDYENAVVEFNKSIELDNSLINSYINLGWIWLEKKNFLKAEINLNKALALNPKSAETLFGLGELNRMKGNIDAACNYYNEASLLGSKLAKQALELNCKK